MNKFCIAQCFFFATNFREIATRTWSIYLVEILLGIFLVFTPSVGVKHVWVDLDGMACCGAYPQCRSNAYVGGVYKIMILRAWKTSHKGQQSLTKLNAKQVAYMSGSFPSLNIKFGFGRNSSFVIQELIMKHFLCFSKDKSLEL
jgi:hypothetical protein